MILPIVQNLYLVLQNGLLQEYYTLTGAVTGNVHVMVLETHLCTTYKDSGVLLAHTSL